MKQWSWPSMLCALLLGCDPAGPPEPAPGCNPIIGDDCLSPFPSSYYEVPDSTSSTGVRVKIPDGVLPSNTFNVPISAVRLNTHDGMSPASPFVVYFAAGVEPSQLPREDSLAWSVTPQSTVQLLEWQTGKRVPVMAELDSNANVEAGERQALLIHPMIRLEPATRYIVALVGLKDRTGRLIEPANFRVLRDFGILNHALASVTPRYEEMFGKLAAAGVARSSLSLSWDVMTASDEDSTGHLVAMRDAAIAMIDHPAANEDNHLTWSVNERTDSPGAGRLRELTGIFRVPLFLTDDSPTATMNFDSDGKPKMSTIGRASFVVDIPNCALTAKKPLPVLVFGHGLFGNAQTELSSDYQRSIGNRLCMVQIGTDWIGLTSDDVAIVGTKVLPDLNHINIVTDRLQQAHVNAQVLTHLFLKAMKDDVAFQVNGKPITDGSEVYYYGISNGGIQGGTYMALSKDVVRGVLNVPGCEFSLIMFRSTYFNAMKMLLGVFYRDALDIQMLLSLIQPEFDYSDPAGFAPHLIRAPFLGTPPKRVLLQEGIGDAAVSNLTTRVLARTVGVPGMNLVQPVYGIGEMPGPLPSAYTQWDVHPMPLPPTGNTALASDNQTHQATRRIEQLQKQIQAFFKPDGQVQMTCNGPCSFPRP